MRSVICADAFLSVATCRRAGLASIGAMGAPRFPTSSSLAATCLWPCQ
jgi:hypothetical protein